MPVKVLGPNNAVWATAPDDSWVLRDKPWPEVGTLVEACYSSRQKYPPHYHYTKARLMSKSEDGGSTWENEHSSTLAFNPDFWRPIANPISQVEESNNGSV